MVRWKNSNVSADIAYQTSFGDLPAGTTYLHYTPQVEGKSVDLRKNVKTVNTKDGMQYKALEVEGQTFQVTTQYTSSSGYMPTLLPVFLDPELLDVTKFDTPLFSGLIRKVTQRGLYAEYNKLTAKGGADWKAELAALAEQDDTYTRSTTRMRYLYATGRISGPMLVASKVWKDALQSEMSAKMASIAEAVETAIIQGDNSSDANQFSGFSTLVTTNTLDKSSTTITIDNLRTAIRTCREAKGHPDLIVTDYKTIDDIKALIQDELRYVNTQKIAFGITAVEFEGLPIIADLAMPTTTNSRELHVWDTSVSELRVLQDSTFEELAKTEDSFKFMIKWYGALIIKAENFCYRIYGLV